MLRLAADENFRAEILAELERRVPETDIVRVRDVGLGSRTDEEVLEWAALEGRVVVTHDEATMPAAAAARIANAAPMAGLIVVRWSLPIGVAVADLALIVECTGIEEWNVVIKYAPL